MGKKETSKKIKKVEQRKENKGTLPKNLPKKVPVEVIQEILGKIDKASPVLVKELGDYMTKNTKKRMLVCKEVIKTGSIKEMKALKQLKGDCSHSDMIFAAEIGQPEMVKFINKEFKDAKILHEDIVKAIKSNKDNVLDILLKNKTFDYNEREYNEIFANVQVNTDYKKVLKVLADNKPKNFTLLISRVLTIVIGHRMREFVENLYNSGLLIDEAFLYYQAIDHNFDLVKSLIKKRGYGLQDTTIQLLIDRSVTQFDPELTDFLITEMRIFDI